ncbi:hypothetical protein J6590_086222 [Homalodisca vitripennis]|nr:hypothetical protein J6590_086222 [Homalodisca vitripennis]
MKTKSAVNITSQNTNHCKNTENAEGHRTYSETSKLCGAFHFQLETCCQPATSGVRLQDVDLLIGPQGPITPGTAVPERAIVVPGGGLATQYPPWLPS